MKYIYQIIENIPLEEITEEKEVDDPLALYYYTRHYCKRENISFPESEHFANTIVQLTYGVQIGQDTSQYLKEYDINREVISIYNTILKESVQDKCTFEEILKRTFRELSEFYKNNQGKYQKVNVCIGMRIPLDLYDILETVPGQSLGKKITHLVNTYGNCEGVKPMPSKKHEKKHSNPVFTYSEAKRFNEVCEGSNMRKLQVLLTCFCKDKK